MSQQFWLYLKKKKKTYSTTGVFTELSRASYSVNGMSRHSLILTKILHVISQENHKGGEVKCKMLVIKWLNQEWTQAPSPFLPNITLLAHNSLFPLNHPRTPYSRTEHGRRYSEACPLAEVHSPAASCFCSSRLMPT